MPWQDLFPPTCVFSLVSLLCISFLIVSLLFFFFFLSFWNFFLLFLFHVLLLLPFLSCRDLSENQLRGSIPTQLCSLTGLTILYSVYFCCFSHSSYQNMIIIMLIITIIIIIIIIMIRNLDSNILTGAIPSQIHLLLNLNQL